MNGNLTQRQIMSALAKLEQVRFLNLFFHIAQFSILGIILTKEGETLNFVKAVGQKTYVCKSFLTVRAVF